MKVRFNPARREYVDDLTGTRVSPLLVGATRTGSKVLRIRPGPGEPFQTVEVSREELDDRRDTFGLDPGARKHYQRVAGTQATDERKRRRKKPLTTKEGDVELKSIGVPTTFKTARKAVAMFMGRNDMMFDDPGFDDADVVDMTHDFMDRYEVAGRAAKGKKRRHKRLYHTTRGKEILAGGKGGGRSIAGGNVAAKAGSLIVLEMLVYMFGRAGSGRRWADVPWSDVEDYLGRVWTKMGGGGAAQESSAPITWWPLASGHYDDDELISKALDEGLGVKKVQKLADYQTTLKLQEYIDRLEDIVTPPKGPRGASSRKILKCIPAADRQLIRHRIKVLKEWAAYPGEIPEWACVPTEWTTQAVAICEFPGIGQDVSFIERACSEPYNPHWPSELRGEYWTEGKTDEFQQYGSGVVPLEYDPAADPSFSIGGTPRSTAESDDLDLPWETAANPRHVQLKRSLMR